MLNISTGYFIMASCTYTPQTISKIYQAAKGDTITIEATKRSQS